MRRGLPPEPAARHRRLLQIAREVTTDRDGKSDGGCHRKDEHHKQEVQVVARQEHLLGGNPHGHGRDRQSGEPNDEHTASDRVRPTASPAQRKRKDGGKHGDQHEDEAEQQAIFGGRLHRYLEHNETDEDGREKPNDGFHDSNR